ncbi:neuromedin-U isoform X2 [Myxocyprinus asiaticus]|uniref:neuromedin-U isoform X2 n=1 Tax=Myxocyprinus asiaticus TaxID=70543 RepID=UPI0022227B2D|nr:neuromedin-U isoform X2 [Myxocyprinus asiaticus]
MRETMRSSNQCESGEPHSTSISARHLQHSAMSPAHSSTLILAVLFISLIPITRSAPVLFNPSSIEHDQLLIQITNFCSFFLSADPSFRTSDVLGDLCFLMLGSLQKSKEITARETSKRSTVLHPLLELIPQLARTRSRRMKLNEDIQGPGRIQNRGYFLYRPRNGRRSAEYV